MEKINKLREQFQIADMKGIHLSPIDSWTVRELLDRFDKLEAENQKLKDKLFNITSNHVLDKYQDVFKKLHNPEYKTIQEEIEQLFVVEINKNQKLLKEKDRYKTALEKVKKKQSDCCLFGRSHALYKRCNKQPRIDCLYKDKCIYSIAKQALQEESRG